jgi:general secretion pathway protein E/type IV pilus assembly protein PilB
VGIGAILVERGLITVDQAAQAAAEQQRSGERMDRVLVRLGLVSSDDVMAALGEQFAMPVVDLNTIEVKDAVLRALPARIVFKRHCAPIDQHNGALRVAISDPAALDSLDELRLLTGLSIEMALVDDRDLRKFIRTHYGVAGDTLDQLAGDEKSLPTDVENSAGGDRNEIEQAQEASVIRLVNDLLLEAIRERATDVHIEP